MNVQHLNELLDTLQTRQRIKRKRSLLKGTEMKWKKVKLYKKLPARLSNVDLIIVAFNDAQTGLAPCFYYEGNLISLYTQARINLAEVSHYLVVTAPEKSNPHKHDKAY